MFCRLTSEWRCVTVTTGKKKSLPCVKDYLLIILFKEYGGGGGGGVICSRKQGH